MLRSFVATTAFSILTLCTATPHARMPAPKPVDPEVLKAINEQVWVPFCASLARNDAARFLALHTDDVVRVSIRRKDVKSGETFRAHTTRQMQRMKEAGRSATLTLRFTQRTHGDDAAFETGVYRFESKTSDHVGYGQFRVLLRKAKGQWKVALDADEPADAAAFDAARPLEDVDWD